MARGSPRGHVARAHACRLDTLGAAFFREARLLGERLLERSLGLLHRLPHLLVLGRHNVPRLGALKRPVGTWKAVAVH